MQLSFFPEPLPDEPLYSLIARYHETLGNTRYKHTIEDLFARSFATATVDLPAHIEILANRLPWASLTPEYFIVQHTAAPYHAYFATDERRSALDAALRGAPPPSPPGVLGVMASMPNAPSRLRYCPGCVAEDRDTHGIAHWHRSHQLPGVVVCPKHAIALQDSTVQRTLRRTRHAFRALEAVLPQGGTPLLAPRTHVATLVTLARDSAWLLSGASPPPALDALRAIVQARLRLIGWLTPGGNVRAQTLRDAWGEHYPEALRASMHCGLGRLSDPLRTTRIMLPGARRSPHPLPALMVLRLIGLPIQDLTAEANGLRENSPRRRPNPPCINHLCPDVATNRWTSVEHGAGPPPRLKVRCARCGLAYTTDPSGTAAPAIAERGQLWQQTLRELVERRTTSLRGVARMLGVDPVTVKRHAASLGLAVPWTPPAGARGADSASGATQEKQRKRWTQLCRRRPTLTRTQLRRIAPALWTWLYRHDRAWLTGHQPGTAGAKARTPPLRARYDERQLCLALTAAARDIVAAPGKPARVTPTELYRRISHPEFHRQRILKQMPNLARLSRRLTESRAHYAKRRIAWCANLYNRSGANPERWQIIRCAGLRADLVQQCDEAIDDALARGR